MSLRVLESGACESLKLGVHGLALGLSSLMCLYNAAAWLQRRERHLAANTLIYGAATVLEQRHVTHHWCAVQRVRAQAVLAAATAAQVVLGPQPVPPPSVSDREAA